MKNTLKRNQCLYLFRYVCRYYPGRVVAGPVCFNKQMCACRFLTPVALIAASALLVLCIDGLDNRNVDGFIQWVKNGGGHVSDHVVIADCGEMEYGIKSVENLEARY